MTPFLHYNLGVDSFVVLCMIFTKFPNRTEKHNETLTFADCKGKYAFVCSEGIMSYIFKSYI